QTRARSWSRCSNCVPERAPALRSKRCLISPKDCHVDSRVTAPVYGKPVHPTRLGSASFPHGEEQLELSGLGDHLDSVIQAEARGRWANRRRTHHRRPACSAPTLFTLAVGGGGHGEAKSARPVGGLGRNM